MNDLIKITLLLKEKLENIKKNELLNPLVEKREHFQLTKLILQKLIKIQEDFKQNPNNLLLGYSSLRYLFETLVSIKLLNSEPNYTYKLYYSVYIHQIEKTKRIIARIENEIELINDYNKEYLSLFENNLSAEEINKKESELYIKSENEITAFWGEYKTNGFGYQKVLIQKLLEDYSKIKSECELRKTEIEKKLVSDNRLIQLFDFKGQSSKVFKELIDKRSWSKKSEITGLEKEYSQVYELSSSLIHSTSYSLFTKLESDISEINYITNLITNYSKTINYLIDEYITIYDLKQIKIFKVEE